MRIEDAIETYDMTMKSCLPEEYPGWIKEVNECLMKHTTPDARLWAPWVGQVLQAIKDRGQVSMSDSN